MNNFTAKIRAELQKKPGEAYVTDTYVAYLLDDNFTVLVITGDFAGASDEEVNNKIMDTINKIV
jgi:hypothetical protein